MKGRGGGVFSKLQAFPLMRHCSLTARVPTGHSDASPACYCCQQVSVSNAVPDGPFATLLPLPHPPSRSLPHTLIESMQSVCHYTNRRSSLDVQLVIVEQAVEVLHQLVNLPDDLVLHVSLACDLITLLVNYLNLILQD